MSNYNGTKCISCGEYFKDGDDVVVCPTCGTPYHRECYMKEGECINSALHESGQSWTADYGNAADSAGENDSSNEPVRCIRCGAENPPNGLFCAKCGMPLSGNQSNERPFNNFAGNGANGFNQQFANGFNTVAFDSESDIDGVKLGDYAKYVDKNPVGFLANFIKFGTKRGKVSFNFGALLFPEFYFFYRKMNKIGILMLVLTTVLSIPGIIYMGQKGMNGITLLNTSIDVESSNFDVMYNLCYYIEWGVRFLCGLFGNYWYYIKAKSDITNLHNELDGKTTPAQVGEMISSKGGTSWTAVVVAVTINFVLTMAVMVGVNFLFK